MKETMTVDEADSVLVEMLLYAPGGASRGEVSMVRELLATLASHIRTQEEEVKRLARRNEVLELRMTEESSRHECEMLDANHRAEQEEEVKQLKLELKGGSRERYKA